VSPARLQDELQSRLDRAARTHRVPGATVATLVDGEVLEAATGVVNLNTGVATTPDTLFLIGSISKVYTATLVMRLVSEGKVALNARVHEYIPHLRLGDPAAADSITVRQLLCHTSGIDEDMELHLGRGDDCVERYVTALATIPQVHRPGDLFSYCNAGIVIAGRLVEEITGLTYDVALRDLLLEPLGLGRTLTLPEEAILHSTAAGHLTDPATGEPFVSPVWALPRAFGPAGSTICTTAGELLSFATLHLDNGRTRDGHVLLSDEAAREMRQPQIGIPDKTLGEAMGLGWRLFRFGDENAFGHWGGNIGQYCQLLVVPERRFGVAILTNAFRSAPVHHEILSFLLSEQLGLLSDDVRALPPEPKDDLSPYAGTYESRVARLEVEVRDGALWMSASEPETFLQSLYSGERPTASTKGDRSEAEAVPLTSLGAGIFRADTETVYGHESVRVLFLDLDQDGIPDYLHTFDYAYPRIS
jgi:CubicO group peptidase (beta-lactamase class C family)